jgi:hypothetical protein
VEAPAFHSARPLSRSIWAAIPVRDSAVATAEPGEHAVGFSRCVSLRLIRQRADCRRRPIRTRVMSLKANSREKNVGSTWFGLLVHAGVGFSVSRLSSISWATADANDWFYLGQRVRGKHMRRILGSGLAGDALHPCHDQKRVLGLDPDRIEPCVLEVGGDLFAG